MEKNLFCCIPQWKKPLPLYPTMEENIFHMGYNGRKPAALWDTMLKIFLGYSTLHKILLWCRIQRMKKFPALGDTIKKNCLPSWDFSLLYPTTENILFCCIPQRRKTFSVVSHSGKKLFRYIPQWQKNVKPKYLHKKYFFSKIILTHESGS